jgi:DNA-binding transcriptional regulator YiaG
MSNQKKPKETASTTVADDVLAALGDFKDAIEQGEVGKRLTCRQVRLDFQPTRHGPALVKRTRKQLNASQALFAKFLRAWELGASEPSPIACRFMDEIRCKPAYWGERFRSLAAPVEAARPE